MKTTQQQGQRKPSQVAARPVHDHYEATDEQLVRLLEHIGATVEPPIKLPVAVDPYVPGIEAPLEAPAKRTRRRRRKTLGQRMAHRIFTGRRYR